MLKLLLAAWSVDVQRRAFSDPMQLGVDTIYECLVGMAGLVLNVG